MKRMKNVNPLFRKSQLNGGISRYPNLSILDSLKIILITAGIPYFIFDILGHYYPVFKENFIFLIIFCLVWMWAIFWLILELVELYIIMVYALDPKYIKVPKHVPNIIKQWYKGLEEYSHLKSEAWILRSKLRFIGYMLFMMVMLFILTIFVIYILYLILEKSIN